MAAPEKCRSARRAVAFSRARTWERQSARGGELADRTPVVRGRSCHWARYAAGVWVARAKAAARALAHWEHTRYRRLYEKWRCIHEHEGAWNSNTGNGYWGGLQMDWGFMHAYGAEFIRRWGLAHRWPVWAQLEAAERAFWGYAGFAGRGYSPWGTRGMCGL